MGRWALVCSTTLNCYFQVEWALTRPPFPCSFTNCDLVRNTCHMSVQASHSLSTCVLPALFMNASGFFLLLLPPKVYPDNASTSLCTKFIHASTNKIRCPVNAVTVRHFCLCRCPATAVDARRSPHTDGSTTGEFTAWNGLTFNVQL